MIIRHIYLGNSFFYRTLACACLFCCFSPYLKSQPVIFINKGAQISVKDDVPFIVKSSFTNSGYLLNESKIIVEGHFTNTDTVEAAGADTFDISGDWTNNRAFLAGQSTVILSGGNQIIKGTALSTFYNLSLDGTGVKSLAGSDAAVSNHLFLNDKEMSTGSKKLVITSTNTAAISRTTGFISSANGGLLERFISDSAEYFFPLGSNSGTPRFRPISVSPAAPGTVSVAARFAHVSASSEGFNLNTRSSEVFGINAAYYHQIEQTQGALPVNITFFYDTLEDGRWTQIAHWQNTPRWELAGFATPGVASPFSTLTLPDYSKFDYAPFALMNPIPLLDTTKTVIVNVSCNSGNNGSICVSDSLLAGTPPFQFLWSNNRTTTCITGLAVGNYVLTVTDSFGASNTYSFTINQPNNILVGDFVKPVSCKGDFDGSICLSVTGDFPPFTYNWLTGPGDSCLTGLEAGFYSVTITDNTGCAIVLPSIKVEEPPLLVAEAQGTDVLCYGFNNGEGEASVTGGTPPYHYLWTSSASDTLPVAQGLAPGSYSVIVTDENGCTATADISISQPDSLIVTAGNDKIIFTGFSTPIDVASVTGGLGSVIYRWTPEASVSDPLSPNTTAAPESSTTYTIAVTDENGCIATDTLRVQVDVNLYLFPDAFVPNGDNRLFLPVTSATVQLLKLHIFNRWGKLLSSDATGWDGKHEGKLQPMDTYVYQAVLQLPDGSQKTEQGDFILIW